MDNQVRSNHLLLYFCARMLTRCPSHRGSFNSILFLSLDDMKSGFVMKRLHWLHCDVDNEPAGPPSSTRYVGT